MKIALGSDHTGHHTKYLVRHLIEKLGHEVVDVGTDSPVECDYREFAAKVAEAVKNGCHYGIFICASGIDATTDFDEAGLKSFSCQYEEDAAQEGDVLCLDEEAYDFENIIRSFIETRKQRR